nr:hypothetical protein 20 [Saccharospirillaceae bacterium]
MHGYPKIIKTRQDVDYLVGYLGSAWATAENIERGLGFLKSVGDNTQHYVFDRALGESEEPDGDEPDYRVMTDDDTGERHQFVLTDNPNALIHKLGFSETEIQQLIDTVEGAQ